MNSKVRKIHWNMHHSCNMQCEFCYLWRKEVNHNLSTDDAIRLIKQSADLDIEWFVFGGGDPLMREDLPSLVAMAKKVGLKVDLQTNALALTSQLFNRLSKSVDRVGLSLDGEDSSTHDFVRNWPGHFQIVIGALEKCEQSNIPVVIRTTVCKVNLGKLNKIKSILMPFSVVKKWSIREFVALGRGTRNKSKYFVHRDTFLQEVSSIQHENISESVHFPIVPVSANEMNSCYCLVSSGGDFYTHPRDGIYRSYGKFPEERLETILSKIDYDSALREWRDSEESRQRDFINVSAELV